MTLMQSPANTQGLTLPYFETHHPPTTIVPAPREAIYDQLNKCYKQQLSGLTGHKVVKSQDPQLE